MTLESFLIADRTMPTEGGSDVNFELLMLIGYVLKGIDELLFSSRPHLCLEVWIKGPAMDPKQVVQDEGRLRWAGRCLEGGVGQAIQA